MFGIGAIIRVIRKTVGGYSRADQLTTEIAALEKEYDKPILSTFAGIERFDAAVRFLDATLVRRLQANPDPAEHSTLVQKYLKTNYEEYQMAKPELNAANATRAEVVALGLALKEISLSLDQEVADFRSRSALLEGEQRSGLTGATQLARQRVDEALLHMSAELREVAQRVERELHASVDSSFAMQAQAVTERIAKAEGEQLARLKDLSAEQGERLSRKLEQRLGDYDQQLAAARDATRTEIGEQWKFVTETTDAQKEYVTRSLDQARLAQRTSEEATIARFAATDNRLSSFLESTRQRLNFQRLSIAIAVVLAIVSFFF